MLSPESRYDAMISEEAIRLLELTYRDFPLIRSDLQHLGGACVGFSLFKSLVKSDMDEFHRELDHYDLWVNDTSTLDPA